MSSAASLVGLPPELLDRILWYLDWDPTATLRPTRDDVLSLSLTSRHLRDSTVPLVFRNVKLSLRWSEGHLLEPGLLLLRKHRPDLAQHIRCVYIRTELGYKFGSQGSEGRAFRMPKGSEQWLSPELAVVSHSQHDIDLIASHRASVDCAVRLLPSGPVDESTFETESPMTAECIITRLVGGPSRAATPTELPTTTEDSPESGAALALPLDERAEEDEPGVYHSEMPRTTRGSRTAAVALAMVMLTLPATVRSIVFEASQARSAQDFQSKFASHVLAAALRVFNGRLQNLTTVGSGLSRRGHLGRSRRFPGFTLNDPVTERLFTEDLITGLGNLDTLKLYYVAEGGNDVHAASLDTRLVWHALASTLKCLEIWNVQVRDQDLERIENVAKGFVNLRKLALRSISFADSRGPAANVPISAPAEVLLILAIALRRALPDCQIEFSRISWGSSSVTIAESGLHWLLHEAIPPGVSISIEREQRLMEDYKSFVPLWQAEDSVRGYQAAEERKGGELVDAAMCSRWKQFSNVRRDQGEWTTL